MEDNNVEQTEEEREKSIFDDLKNDFKEAKDAKSEIDDLIQEWNDLYYGIRRDSHGEIVNDDTKKSKIVMREIAKQIEWQKPNITEPFTSTQFPINITAPKSEARARIIEKWANHEFTTEFDREEFMSQLVDILLREGTVWVRSAWETKTKVDEEVFDNVTMDEIMSKEINPTEIFQKDNGKLKAIYRNEIVERNNPTIEIIRNEHAFPDPGARTIDELRFFITIDLMSVSDLRELGYLDEDKIDSLQSKISSESREETSLGQARNADGRSYGYDDDYEPNDNVRKHIEIVTYWGYYDVNEDGIAEPIRAIWAKDYNINLLLEDNPMPDKSIPFDRAVYSSRPFSIWGNSVAFFLGDNQRAKNGMVRGILDNMSLANNGQKFIMRGALDYVNFKRMNNGYRNIIVNKPDAIKDGSFNQLPSSVFNTLQMFTKESEDLVGVSSGGPALSNANVGKDGQQAQLTMSQQRMVSIVRNISNMMRKVIGRWISMAEIFLTDEQILELFNEQEIADINAFEGSGRAKVNVNVATEISRNMKLQQYNMLMQQSRSLEGELPPGALKDIVAEMLDLFGMHEKATSLRLYERQPSQEEIALQQLEVQNAQLTNAKLNAEIEFMAKDVEARYMNAQARMMEANANYGYKQAQSAEKIAKTQAHQVDTAMKPVQVENEINKTNKQNNNKG